jgi:ubiquinone/menaquinone biosynthesis C-methylase UbiE
MITMARKKPLSAKFVLGNCLDIPFENNYFNAVVTRGVLISHVEKDYAQQFIDETKRVLSPGGLFVFDFITQYNKSESEKLKKKAVFDQKSITKVLEKSGFKIISFEGNKSNRVNTVACIKE